MIDWQPLVDKCKRGDSRAQRELYDHFKTRLMGVCRRYASSREEAQDILQEVFIKVFSKIDQVNEPEKLSGWLTKLTVNTSINYYHRNKHPDFQDVTLAQIESSDYEALLAGITDEYLLKVINSLPDGCRMVFNLSSIEGYSHPEIAELLGVSVSTSRSQLNYARSLLKERLNAVGITKVEKYA